MTLGAVAEEGQVARADPTTAVEPVELRGDCCGRLTARHGPKRAARNSSVQAPVVDITVTASLGVAAWVPGEVGRDVIGRADRALYRAKATGRNRVVADRAARRLTRLKTSDTGPRRANSGSSPMAEAREVELGANRYGEAQRL